MSNKIWKCLFQQPALHYSGKQPERRNDKAVRVPGLIKAHEKCQKKRNICLLLTTFLNSFFSKTNCIGFGYINVMTYNLQYSQQPQLQRGAVHEKKRTLNDKTNTQTHTGNSFETSFQTDYHTLCCSYISLKLGALNFQAIRKMKIKRQFHPFYGHFQVTTQRPFYFDLLSTSLPAAFVLVSFFVIVWRDGKP